MNRFIGREHELKLLNDFHATDRFQLVIMYGRRRVGKTRLLAEFCKDKHAIFHVAEQQNQRLSLEQFSAQIIRHFEMEQYMTTFATWEKALLFLADRVRDTRTVLVIDEFPYLAEENSSLLSTLQKIIDHHFLSTKLFMVLCGSSMSFMENQVLGHKSPLFGRRTAQMKVEPFAFKVARQFFPEYSAEEQVQCYGVLGGTAHYLDQFSPELSFDQNMVKYLFSTSSYLYEEPGILLKQEMRNPAVYQSILEAIASGASKMNEIATKIGESSSKVAGYMRHLIDLGLVEKMIPVTDKHTSRKTIYQMRDPLFQFHFRYVFPYRHLIEQGMGEEAYAQKVKPILNQYLGQLFEKICTECVWELARKEEIPFFIERIGRWWGNNPTLKRQEEIDLVALGEKKGLFCECKYRNEPTDVEVLKTLERRSELIVVKERYYYVFSKAGFTDRAQNYAKATDTFRLFDLEDLSRVLDADEQP